MVRGEVSDDRRCITESSRKFGKAIRMDRRSFFVSVTVLDSSKTVDFILLSPCKSFCVNELRLMGTVGQ